jgi:nucleotide-binding universal stress UspA family protein
MHLNHLLVATDFSEYSRYGLKYALALSADSRAHVTVLHVLDASHRSGADAEEAASRALQQARNEMRRFIHPYAGNSITQVILIGNPAEKIVRFAADNHVGMIVMATHGRTGLAHMLIGGVAEKVVRHSSIPVLTVKPAAMAQQNLVEQDIVHDLHFDNVAREVDV